MAKFTLAAIDIGHPEAAQTILKKAHALAQIEGLSLAVVTVIPDFGMSVVGDFFKEGTQDAAIASANKQLHTIVSEAISDASVKHILRVGTIYKEILDTAQDIDVSLIVMGASRPDLSDYLLGPNVSRVVRHAKASIYVVRGAP